MEDHQLAAQLIAAGAVALLVALLAAVRRTIPVTTEAVTFAPASGMQRTLPAGSEISSAVLEDVERAHPGATRTVRKSALASILIGSDNRTSTSKTVMVLWTIAIAYGLVALLVADLLGDHRGWNAQLELGLQEEYVLLLGGPYAAAIFAKVTALSQARGDGRSAALPGSFSAGQIVSGDNGDTDVGDLQYVLFNVIALGYFLSQLLTGFENGFPKLPALLTGLVLTSASGYAAKKLIRQGGPALTSVIPAAAAPGTAGVLLYGTNLVATAPTGSALPPTIVVGGQHVVPTAFEAILGADRLTLTIPPDAAPGAGTIGAVRADGQPALGPAGTDGMPFTVAAPPP